MKILCIYKLRYGRKKPVFLGDIWCGDLAKKILFGLSGLCRRGWIVCFQGGFCVGILNFSVVLLTGGIDEGGEPWGEKLIYWEQELNWG